MILSSSQNELMNLYCQSLTTIILVMDYIQVGGIFRKNSGFEVYIDSEFQHRLPQY